MRAIEGLLLGLAFLALQTVADAQSLMPRRWGGRCAIGYDETRNVSTADVDPASGTGDGRYWFAQPRDAQLCMGLWADWKMRLAGKRTRLRLDYERLEWANGRILGRDRFTAEASRDMSSRSSLDCEVEYAPQIYSRHRADKDALLGEPEYRPQARRELAFELGWEQKWRAFPVTRIFLTYTIRDENSWFDERDARRIGAGLTSGFALFGSSLELTYEYRGNESRNEPDLESDLSYREHVAELQLGGLFAAPGGPWGLDLRNRWKFRNYTTHNIEDDRHYGRRETIYSWLVKLRRPGAVVSPFVSVEATGHSAQTLAAEESAEEDDIGRILARIGVEWERVLALE